MSSGRARIFLVALLAFIGIGCRPNHRTWEKGNIKADGYLYYEAGGKRAEYYSVDIGQRESPIESVPDLRIEVKPGRLVSLKEFTFEKAREEGETHEEVGRTHVAGPGETVFYINKHPDGLRWGYSFRFLDKKLAQIEFDGTNAAEVKQGFPAIWNERGKRYGFRLTDRDLNELFGPPEKVFDYYHKGGAAYPQRRPSEFGG